MTGYKANLILGCSITEVLTNRTLLESFVTNLMFNAMRNSDEEEVSFRRQPTSVHCRNKLKV